MGRLEPLGPVEAYEAIQKILELRDSISWSAHATKRARERNFNADDVRRVLVRGALAPKPEWHEPSGNWRYKVCGEDYDGEPLAVVIVLEPQFGRLTLITGEDC
jgi:hypothetical protein